MLSTKTPVCKICDQEGHYAFQCFQRQTKPLATVRYLRTKGKATKLWDRTRKTWLDTHHPDANGFYYCYLCGKPLRRKSNEDYEVVTLDHVKSRSRHPELRHDQDNLRPCCWACNTAKGSRSPDEVAA